MSFDQSYVIHNTPPANSDPTVEDIARDALDLAMLEHTRAPREPYSSERDYTRRTDAVRILLAALPWLAEDVLALKGEGK